MTAYYNEHDAHAAQWLRNLIAAGHIAAGEVDERDIRDVRPDEIRHYTQCHFFAGIGIWSAALRQVGWPDNRRVWTGSCPCQPFSAAGRGDGVADERHLWPHWFHLVAECRPVEVFGEQVASPDGLAWLDLVQDNMEAADYAFGAIDTCAAGFGAPHIRQRLYIAAYDLRSAAGRVADAAPSGCMGWAGLRDRGSREQRRQEPADIGGTRGMADATGRGRGERGNAAQPGQGGHADGGGDGTGGMAKSDSGQRDRIASREGCQPDRSATGRIESDGCIEPGGGTRGMADADGRDASPEREQRGRQYRQFAPDGGGDDGFAGAMPTNGFWRDADWLFSTDGKWRPVRPGSFPLAHGAAARVGRLRAYGNGLCLAQAAGFFRGISGSRNR